MDRYETRLNTPLANHATLLRELLTEIGYVEDLRRTCKTADEALNRENNVNEMLKSFEEFQARSTEGLRGFLDEMSLRQEREDEEDEAKGTGVTLITLHAAKGLEFPHVYLIGLEEGLLPHNRSTLEGTVDEERRLLYVGITRARETLALTWCAQRIKYGSPSAGTPSSFLKELSPEWIERCGATQILNTPVKPETVKDRFAAMRAMLEKAGSTL
jgi:superfamily I DNA/RNA helicase